MDYAYRCGGRHLHDGVLRPQVRKTWTTQETRDLSLRMLLILAVGLALWCLYGMARSDAVIMVANGASLAMLSLLIYWKLRLP
jgi:MtN3 and saliva related transmembrane protein